MPAAAQTQQRSRPERPYRGIFASGVDNSGQSLTVSSTVSGGYDDNVLADATRRNTIQNSREGTLAQFSGGLNYSLAGARGSLTAGAGTSLRYYPSLENDLFKTYNAGIAGQVLLLKKPNLTAHQSVNYQPFTFLSGLSAIGSDPGLDAVAPPEPDFVPIASQYISYESGLDLAAPVSRRVSFLSSYSYRVSDRNDFRFVRNRASMGFDVGLTRDLSLRLMYRYTEARYPGRIVRTHSPDVGLDFHHALSLTRRTSLTFGVGTEATAVNDRTRFRATGNVDVVHEIGRSWQADASYRRGTYFLDTLAEPLFADVVRAGLGGLLTRRLQFNAMAIATIGNAGFAEQRRFDSYRGSVSLSTALNRFMNVGVDYAYYKYIFDPLIELQPGLPHDVNRQSIRAHVSVWAPLLNTRRRDASR